MKIDFEELTTKITLDKRNIKETANDKVLTVNFNEGVITEITFDKIKLQESENAKNVKIIMLKGEKGDKGEGGGVTSYLDLTDKPQIEGITLEGNKAYEELNLQRITNSEIEALLS